MGIQPDLEKILFYKFDRFCKIVIQNEIRNIIKQEKIQAAHETYLSELDERRVEQLGAATYDEYATDYTHFNVSGYEAEIRNDALAEALSSLPVLEREIVLLKHYFDMTDNEVGEALNLARSTVQRKRSKTLNQLKRKLGETK